MKDVSVDGMIYTFHLRKGIEFQNGSAFNAESVKLSLEYACNTTTLGKDIASINVINAAPGSFS